MEYDDDDETMLKIIKKHYPKNKSEIKELECDMICNKIDNLNDKLILTFNDILNQVKHQYNNNIENLKLFYDEKIKVIEEENIYLIEANEKLIEKIKLK